MPRPLFSWVAPTPEVVIASRPQAHPPGKAGNPRGGDHHAVKAPTPRAVKRAQPDLKVVQSEPTPTPTHRDDLEETSDPAANGVCETVAAVEVSAVATTYSPEEIKVAVDELLEPAAVAAVVSRDQAVAPVVSEAPPARMPLSELIALLVRKDTTREDLELDQSLPPQFRVLGPNGVTIAEFAGAEHATHLNHTIHARGVIRIADNKRMTERRG